MNCHFGRPDCHCKFISTAFPEPPGGFDLTDPLILPNNYWPPLYIANLDDGPPDEPFFTPTSWLTPEESGISLDLPPAVVEDLKSKLCAAAIANFHVLNNELRVLRAPHKKQTSELKKEINRLLELISVAEDRIKSLS